MKPPVDRTRTSAFQGMRVIAILGIILLHAGKSIGDVGCLVSFFFVLSGFLFHDYGDIKEYYAHCFRKVFPIYWLTFFVDFILHGRSLTWSMIPHLFLLQTYWPMPEPVEGIPYYYEYLGVSWFLSCLLFCYFVAPYLSKLISKIHRDYLFLTLALLVFVIAFILNADVPISYQKWAWYTSPYYRCIEYCLGMLLSNILVGRNESSNSTKNSEALGILCLLTYYVSFLFLKTNLWAIPNLFIIYFIYEFHPKWCSRTLGSPFVSKCATYIMPVYLVHQSLILTIKELGGGWIYCTVFSLLIGVLYAIVSKRLISFLIRQKNIS